MKEILLVRLNSNYDSFHGKRRHACYKAGTKVRVKVLDQKSHVTVNIVKN